MKRKNDEVEENGVKRVALDAEQIDRLDIEADQAKTAQVPDTDDVEESEELPAKDLQEPLEDLEISAKDQEPPVTPIEEPQDTALDQSQHTSGVISSHNVEDPTYVHFRMLCPVKQASLIVGKGGEKISHIKESANCRINVSDNLRNVPERIITVRGPAENVAKAFGLIVRAIVDEPEDQPSGAESQPFMMKLLFPHPLMGYIIGKKGARFREIEENSALRLKLEERTLPQSTDRVLNVTGVADAIHIATYYILQTVLENKQLSNKCIFYNPANYNVRIPNAFPQMIPSSQGIMPMPMPMQQMQMAPQMAPQMMNMMGPGSVNYDGRNRTPYNNGYPTNGMPMMNMSQGEKIEQDYHVPREHIGLVIGKGGSNVKHIREVTKCYVKINPEVPGAETRLLTLQGTAQAIQAAIQMISNKVEHEKKKIAHQLKNQPI